MKNFRYVVFILVVIMFIWQINLFQKDKKLEQLDKKPTVMLSTFSLYDMAKNIAKDTFEVGMILPFGVDAHSFEPTPKLMAKILDSDLVVYSGAGLEPWTHSFEFKSKVINMSKFVHLIKSKKHHKSSSHEHHGALDPHYWLDIQNMIDAVGVLTKEFITLLPQNKELYNKNKDNYIKMLKSLDTKYKDTLSECKKDTIIVNHNAFSYLSKNYGFHVEALSGLSPDAQPDAKSIINLMQHIKEHNVSTIFFESFVSDRAMMSISKEVGVKLDVLQPIGNITADEAKQNLSYEKIMLLNLEKISTALECK
ncbi:MAG: zinc ABC transporter substrate-binding protein [Epsilonproteobacteria bacterium]|nr:zinc ABC transporter substrate-binding protein [Campylobacterota bacterium]